jgi:hypothetical protein
VVFDLSEWNNGQIPLTVEEEGEDYMDDASLDIVDLDHYTPVVRIGGRKRSNTTDSMTPTPSGQEWQMKRSKTATTTSAGGKETAAKVRQGSEAPSITPSTTKRARQNRKLTAPVSPQPDRQVQKPVIGSVLDRVKAIEHRRTQEGPAALLPMPRAATMNDIEEKGTRSPSRSPTKERNDTFVPGRGGRPILTRIKTSDRQEEEDGEQQGESVLVTSPIRMKSPLSAKEDKIRYTHGLVPRPQLFVANPDGRQASSGS